MIEFLSKIWPPSPGLPLLQGGAGAADLVRGQDRPHSPAGGGRHGRQPRRLGTPQTSGMCET